MPKTTQPRKTWQYVAEFKIRAVKLSFQKDILVKDVAEGLDIHPMMLSRWRKEYLAGKLQGDGQKRTGLKKKKRNTPVKEITDYARLKKDNERLKKENNLLKKWQRYLAEQHQNDLNSSKDTES